MLSHILIACIVISCLQLGWSFMAAPVSFRRATMFKGTSLQMAAEKKSVINKAELLDKLMKKTGYKKKDLDVVVEGFAEILKEDVLGGGSELRLRDFGTFKQKCSAARTGRNPRTGEAIPISASKTLAFTAAAAMKIKEE